MKRLRGAIQHYDWGHARAIPDILGRPPSGRPEAEYWLGTHPGGPAAVVGEDGTLGPGLDAVIAADPTDLLGPMVADRYGDLPYLLKVLAADRPLSIQAHPDADQAAAGFAREDASGIDRRAPKRNYRDPRHKPELVCAVTPFEARCGFRPLDATRRLLGRFEGSEVAELRRRLDRTGADGAVLGDALAWLLRLDPVRARALVAAVAAEAEALMGAGAATQELAWTVRLQQAFPGDVGVVVALLLNHVTLRPGQAVFLGAGNLHCYLSGVAIEVMASSDNVLRGGLTTKHVDVDELLSVVSTEPIEAPVQSPDGPVHAYEAPVPEFALTRLSAADRPFDATFEPVGPDIVLVTSGSVELVSSAGGQVLSGGEAVLLGPTDGPYGVTAAPDGREATTAWRVSVGGYADGRRPTEET